MAPGEERVDVDSLKKGKRTYPPGSYIGGELIVLNAKAAGQPLVFHLSTKSRQGRSNLIIQCGKFPAVLNGNSALEKAYTFLEARFRQYIRIQADFEGLEVLDVVTTKGKPKRIDIRYGAGGAILAQDGGIVHIVNDSVASWFPSQSSSEEAEAQQSAGSHSSTKPPPAAQNSPLAIFPTSPPTSEPPMPVEQREINTSNQSRVRKLQSREVDLPPGGSNIKKLRTEREGHSGPAVQENMTSPALKPAHSNTNSKPVSHDHKPVSHAQTAPPHTAVASRRSLASNSSAEKQPVFTSDSVAQIAGRPDEPVAADVTSGAPEDSVDSAKGFRISQLLADPTLLSQLSLQQREALRKAAEQKWFLRNPLFTPDVTAEIQPKPPAAKRQSANAEVQVTEGTVSAIPVSTTSNMQSSRTVGFGDDVSALAAEGGLIVPGTRTTSKVIYPTLEEMHSLDPGFSPLVNVIALVYDLRAPRALGRRGDVLHRVRLADPSRLREGPWLSLFTRSDEQPIPSNLSLGSVMLVRGAKLHRDNYFDLKCPAHADWTYSLLIPDASGNPRFVEGVGKRHMEAPSLSQIERSKMLELQRWYFARFPVAQVDPESGNDVGEYQEGRGSSRAKTWRSARDRDFCDLTVEVLHVRETSFPTKRELLVTDYTKNDSFMCNEYHTTDFPEVGYITLLTLWDGVALSADLNVINDGDIVTFRNVAIKATSTRYGIEGNVREATGRNGVPFKRFRVLDPQADPQAAELIRRRDRLKQETREKQRSETIPISLQPYVPSTLNHHPLSVSDSALATITTRHSTQRLSSITELLSNPVPDNAFRLKAWVCKIQPRTLNAQGEESKRLRDLVVRRCKTCDRCFEQKYCVWCKTMLSDNLEYQYLFVIHLKENSKDKTESLPVIISSRYMSNVLPSLPAVSLVGIDEEKELIAACRQVEEMFQGHVVSGTRQCPVIDWSLTRLSMRGENLPEGVFASGMQRASP